MNQTTVKTKNGPFLPETAGRASLPDRIFRIAAIASAGLAILLTLAFFVQLAWHSVPAFREFGLRFFWSTEWDSAEMKFGAACAIYGTLITTVIALLIAVPTAFLTALFLVEIAPPAISRVFGCALDLLAAIPSVIYGMWGLFVFVPFMQNRVQPFLTDTLHLGVIPLFDGPMTGFGFLTAGIVLALMSLPFMSAIMRDVFRMVPPVVKESAYGIGATTWEVAKDVTMRYGMQGLLGAVFLGLGRAVGETMAVLFIIGNSETISASFYESGATIASVLANKFAEAEGLAKSSLFALGLILLCITFSIQIFAQIWLNKVRRNAGGGL